MQSFTSKAHHDTYPTINPLNFNLAGRSVLITGASRNVGRATAISFARAGASRIIITARCKSDLKETTDLIRATARDLGQEEPEVTEIEVDIGDAKSVEMMVETLQGDLTSLDILINNAGVMEDFEEIVSNNPSEWWTTWEVNVRGTYLVTKALLPLIINGMGPAGSGLGIVIVLSSIGAHFVHSGGSGYMTSKLALLRFTEFLAVEYGSKGIIPIAFHPGGVPSYMSLRLPKHLQWALVDTPELAGDTTVWLAAERREWLSGRYVDATWDMKELEERKDEIVDGDKLKMKLVV